VKKRILIIEDELIIANDIKFILEDEGYEVDKIIKNGDEAISHLSFSDPDLVLCDINIRGTKDGIEVALEIQKRKKVPFVFLTSLSDRPTLDRAKHALPYGYIVKPFEDRDIVSALEMALYKFDQELQSLEITKETLDKIAVDPLTDKEYDVVKEMCKGKTYPLIESALSISQNTLKYHTKHIFIKFDVASRASLMQKLLSHYARV